MLARERGPRWQIHAQRRNLRISVCPGHPAPAATLPAIPAARGGIPVSGEGIPVSGHLFAWRTTTTARLTDDAEAMGNDLDPVLCTVGPATAHRRPHAIQLLGRLFPTDLPSPAGPTFRLRGVIRGQFIFWGNPVSVHLFGRNPV